MLKQSINQFLKARAGEIIHISQNPWGTYRDFPATQTYFDLMGIKDRFEIERHFFTEPLPDEVFLELFTDINLAWVVIDNPHISDLVVRKGLYATIAQKKGYNHGSYYESMWWNLMCAFYSHKAMKNINVWSLISGLASTVYDRSDTQFLNCLRTLLDNPHVEESDKLKAMEELRRKTRYKGDNCDDYVAIALKYILISQHSCKWEDLTDVPFSYLSAMLGDGSDA